MVEGGKNIEAFSGIYSVWAKLSVPIFYGLNYIPNLELLA
jgi:hypothetical protein